MVDKPEAAQSVVSVAMAGAERKTPDYFPMMVMNTALGGQFASRLNMNLREDKGYTYGAGSGFDWRTRDLGTFVASASVQTAVTAPALKEMLNELQEIAAKRPVAGDELDFDKKYMTRAFPADFETSSSIAARLETLVEFHLPDDYFETVLPGIAAVTGDDVTKRCEKISQAR